MWMRFAERLRCVLCLERLQLRVFECGKPKIDSQVIAAAREREPVDESYTRNVESGVLLCERCGGMYPIFRGLPVMLPYRTALHERFRDEHVALLDAYPEYAFPSHTPVAGELAVMASFSKEWLEYEYDGVMWEMSYEDHEQRFLKEMGSALDRPIPGGFLEVGCGLGLTTFLAQKHSNGDCVGLDLSLAALKATRHYRANPFLHFVQASVFALPFAAETFDVVYSRGVLHHTMSTKAAFERAARLCRPGGTTYVWVYGIGSIRETAFRRAVYGLECAVRPALSRMPDSMPAKVFLNVMATGYVVFNRMRRAVNPAIQPLTLSRGVHAARDRFTPRYAHRHDAEEVTEWFRSADFGDIELLDWRTMPAADHDDYRRNVGVRATRIGQRTMEISNAA